MWFLKGLNEACNTMKTYVLLMEPFPSIYKVFSSIIQEQIPSINNILQDRKSLMNVAKRENNWNSEKQNNWIFLRKWNN